MGARRHNPIRGNNQGRHKRCDRGRQDGNNEGEFEKSNEVVDNINNLNWQNSNEKENNACGAHNNDKSHYQKPNLTPAQEHWDKGSRNASKVGNNSNSARIDSDPNPLPPVPHGFQSDFAPPTGPRVQHNPQSLADGSSDLIRDADSSDQGNDDNENNNTNEKNSQSDTVVPDLDQDGDVIMCDCGDSSRCHRNLLE
jgi:hypothetical protein